MSSIDESLVAILAGAGAVTALCGQRVYPLRARQTATRPYIVYQRISTVRYPSHDGASGLARPRFQLRITGASYATVRQVADAVRTTLEGYSGEAAGVRIDGILLDNELDELDEATDDEGSSYSTLQDYFVWHGE